MMKWMFTALTLLLAVIWPASAQDFAGGGWMLEATLPLQQVSAVAVARTEGGWAAASPYQCWLFKDADLVANGPLRARTGLQFIGEGMRLAAFGDEWEQGKEHALASKPKGRLAPDYFIASSLILPGDSTMAAFVRPARPKGDLGLTMPGEQPLANKVLLLDLQTGNVLKTLAEGLPLAEELEFVAAGHILAFAHERFQAFDIQSGAELANLPLPHEGMLQHVAASPDGRMMVLADPHLGKAAIVDLATWQFAWKGQLAGSGIRHLAFGREVGQLFFASKKGGLYQCTIDLKNGPSDLQSILQGEVLDFAIGPDGKRIFVAGNDAVKILKRN